MTEDEEDTVTVREIKRQSVILVFAVLGAVVLASIGTMETDPAARHRAVMRGALAVKRFAQWNADRWGDLALSAGTVYNRYRD
jgi:hypothetical protein